MEQPLVLKLNDDDPWHVTKTAFDLISDYIQPENIESPKEMATTLDKLSPLRRSFQEGELVEDFGLFLLAFWRMLVVVVGQIPHSHVAQDRLVDLVAELDALPPERPVVSRILTKDPNKRSKQSKY